MKQTLPKQLTDSSLMLLSEKSKKDSPYEQ